ncbi:TnsD family Tn7-like transposition protein [Clostridium butyricum]|uniref:Uncharacterized protein n=1 Tax=Clostridium butyricum E4 str. BoNT E BL5262 TaxID=632245 RepID=C4IEV2_CLOBU|nr:TnsD family Tn7-like transposition protein [Clostridium butyricum]EDT74389.1 conserved hypothetical protein [Clostridium butyricum 5521]EEP55422.1 conserved hypothetical protein [Clostridium butyricum E4 str. BoNT E BL5262]NFL29690.1 hypothetical protein [Clostridium butyricum]NFS16805.1 hypothetical protein [Clostridium butyricum]
MLYFFTDFYEEEIFFSAINRYGMYSGNLGERKISNDLFGVERINTRKLFPSYLNRFSKSFEKENRYEPEYIINNHTLLPLYLPFLNDKRIQQIIKDMKGDNPNAINLRIGEFTGGICKNIGMRVCTKCIEEDENKYGEGYLHREHQVPGNRICHIHSSILKRVRTNKYSRSKKYDIGKIENESIVVDRDTFQKFKSLSEDIHNIFKANKDVLKFDDILQKYKVRLIEKGFASVTGITNWNKVNREFVEFFSNEYLELLDSDINLNEKFTWTRNLFEKNLLIHPIKHILFIQFLFGSVNELIKYKKKKYEPFGSGPWPCLNIVAKHYKQDVIKEVAISNRSTGDKPLGIFVCSCGYIYTRLGPDKKSDDKYVKRTVKEYGPVWEAALNNYILKGEHCISHLKQLMACDGKTVGKYAKKLGVFKLLNSRMKTDEVIEKKRRYEMVLEEKYKKDILEFLLENPYSSRSEIAEKMQKQYIWLYRYREEWLNSKLPKPIANNAHTRDIKRYVDWEDRDKKFSERVIEVINEMQKNNKRITISGISAIIKFPIKKYSNKLPNTMKILYDNNILKKIIE